MSQFADWLLWELGRTTLWLAIACVLVAAVLRLARVTSPTLHRMAWCAALVVGWLFVRMPLDVPWYPAKPLVATSLEPDPPDVAAYDPGPEILPAPAPLTFNPPIAAAPTVPAKIPPSWSLPSWPQLAILAWIVGMLVLVAAWVGGYLWFVLRLPKGREIDLAWNDEWRLLQQAQGVGRPIPLRLTDRLGPLLCRLPNGYQLLVPEALWCKLSPAERRAILRHELAHWRRGDVWKSLAARVLALPHWFNPAGWLAVRRFDEAAEWACDSAATEGEPTAYAKILMRVGELAARRTRYGAALRGRALAARIRRLVSLGQKEDSAMKKAFLISVVACLAASALVRLQLVAQEPDKQPAAETPRETDSLPIFADDPSPPAPNDAQSKPPAPAGPPRSLREAEQEMVAAAKKAYEAALAAYQAQSGTFDPVPAWSSRWLAAELAVARKPGDRIAAATAHLDRMRQLQTNIKKLYDVGTRGGEALEMSAANFYVAEAERKLAELKSRPTPMPTQTFEGRPATPVTTQSPAKAAHTPVPETFEASPNAGPSAPKANSSKGDLRYDDKTFDEWLSLLRTELSPVRRSEAVRAIGEFGAHGMGAEAASAILDAEGEHTISDITFDGGFNIAALQAFRRIPPAEGMPIALERLKSGNGLQRLFVLQRVPNLPADALPLLFAATKDGGAEVRTSALLHIAFLDHDSPKLPDALRAALESDDRDEVVTAIRLAGGAMVRRPAATVSATLAPFPALVPELIGLLNDADGKFRGEAANALELIGPAAVAALQNAAANPDTGKAAQEVLEKIQNPNPGPRK